MFMNISFRCTNGDFYVASSSSMGLALLVLVGSGLLMRVLYLVGNQPSLSRKSPIMHLSRISIALLLFVVTLPSNIMPN